MTNILILGGGGVIGQKLARALVKRGHLRGRDINSITLADVVSPAGFPEGSKVQSLTCDMSDPSQVSQLINPETDVIFLLAAIVSGTAEKDFDLGIQVNLTGVLNVLAAARATERCPVVIYTSSMAVYGGDVPDPITDLTYLNPQTSYGMQKAVGELLLTDFSRKGFVDGRGFRLPTISVRPGQPNGAASSFMSSIIREPLNGQEAICPVGRDFLHYYLSPKRCVENLIRGAELNAAELGLDRTLIMPGRMWSIGQMIDAMTAVCGPEPAKLIKWESQPDVERIVKGWRFDLRPDRGLALGFQPDASFEDNVRYYVSEDLEAS
ncbi:D-erythronate dehydrogenase [Thioclava sp. FR2]|uniref:D-erythronate dehydrogenase n=1 Tax=Thioclava sp. FR2 TaxID=3445780 RepID=UPI003EB72798